jgi:hypothetical protein
MRYRIKATDEIINLGDLRLLHDNVSFPPDGPPEEWLGENGYTLYRPEIEPPPEPELDKIAILENHRWAMENGGIEVGEIHIQTDRETRANLIGARILARENPDYSIQWKTMDGFVTLNADQIIYAADLAAAHVQACFAAESAVMQNIAELTSIELIMGAFGDEYLEKMAGV